MHNRYTLHIPQSIYDAMTAHAISERPNECVGLLAGTPDGHVRSHDPLVNALASPRRFESEPRSMFEAEKRRRAAGLEFIAVYHSHPTSDPVPSATDLQQSYGDATMNLIISLQGESPVVRAWWYRADGYEPAVFVVE